MIPLLQMHPVVQNRRHFDFHRQSRHLSHDYPALHHQPGHAPWPSDSYCDSNSTPRAFSLRGPHGAPSLHRNSSSFSGANAIAPEHSAENSLRRKTPSGTIDNGYDGSHLASGPPPLKHVAMPAALTRMFPVHGADRAARSASGPLGCPRQMPPAPGLPYLGGLATGLGTMPPSDVWGRGAAGLGLEPASGDRSLLFQQMPQTHLRPVNNLQPMPSVLSAQAAMPSPFGPAGYQSLGPWTDSSMSDYRTTIPLANGYTPQNAVVDSTFIPSQTAMMPGLSGGFPLGHPHPFRMPLACHPLDDGFFCNGHGQSLFQTPQRSLEALSLSPTTPASLRRESDAASLTHFNERVLWQAHRAYADLLVYLSHCKQPQSGRSRSGSRSGSKMVLFPKPPRQLTESLHASSSRSMQPVYGDTSQSYVQHLAEKRAAHALACGVQPTDAQSRGSQNAYDSVFSGSPTIITAGAFEGQHLLRNPLTSMPHRTMADMISPVVNARVALETLAALCERSGWNWVNGILLGGCLHYSLEHYEDALEWFKRILGLEERCVVGGLQNDRGMLTYCSHVEAMSNIAATLYCLNRHDEAEKHWWRAVQIRPSYLEAAEHLVGLLCSNHRSHEAVALISHIQDALRIPATGLAGARESKPSSTATAVQPPTSDQGFSLASATDGLSASSPVTDEAKQAGFGSSGYAIPASENGRILLLVHAKANMLYALKDVNRASEAFEEAVLISTGKSVRDIWSLIRTIQQVLAPNNADAIGRSSQQAAALTTLLLPPERAKNTAQLVFASNGGQLPGLTHVPEGGHRKSAISTTSNSLLSLAKIFQDAMSSGGSDSGTMQRPAGVGDVLALYYLSLSLQESPSTANNMGILLASVPQCVPAPSLASVPETFGSNIPGIVPGSGLALALAYYHYGLSLDPKHVHLHTNLGSLLKDIGQLDLAISMYEKAVACDGTFDIALTNLANAVKDRGRVNDAIIYYKRAVASNPEFAEAVCGLLTALNSVCDWRGRGGVLLEDGNLDRWHVDDEGMLQDARARGSGSGLMQRVVGIVNRQLRQAAGWGRDLLSEQAIQQLAKQLRDAGSRVTDPGLDLEGELRKWAGRPWEGSRVLRLVERCIRASMRSWYQDKYTRGVVLPGGYARPKPPASLSVPAAPTVLPFHTFTCPLTAEEIRRISERNALRISCSTLRSPWLPLTVYEPPAPPRPHLNVGYVSSDFNNHPLAHLMQSVFGFHDQKRVKAFCYATTASDRSVHRQQIEREAPVFRDVSSWSSDKLVDQIVADGIHILVNLNGYTRGARNEVFAARPAPIQMSFMGFAGTLGAEWCDYLLADTMAVPPATLRPYRSNLNLTDVFQDEDGAENRNWVYSENIIYCRDTFFCCDHAQSADETDERGMTWEEEQSRRWKMRKELFPKISDDTIILGNFNQLYKVGWLPPHGFLANIV